MVSPQTGTLADFLLARIAEDEALAREFDACDWAGVDAWGEGTDFFFGDRAPASTARVLAECDTKRRIVRYCTPSDDTDQVLLGALSDPGVSSEALAQAEPFFRVAGAMVEDALSDILKCLALPYADHPDYREEWRP